jgi:hypothetical protein
MCAAHFNPAVAWTRVEMPMQLLLPVQHPRHIINFHTSNRTAFEKNPAQLGVHAHALV